MGEKTNSVQKQREKHHRRREIQKKNRTLLGLGSRTRGWEFELETLAWPPDLRPAFLMAACARPFMYDPAKFLLLSVWTCQSLVFGGAAAAALSLSSESLPLANKCPLALSLSRAWPKVIKNSECSFAGLKRGKGKGKSQSTARVICEFRL